MTANLKEAGCEEHTNSQANLWSDGQKSHTRLCESVKVIQQAITQQLVPIYEPLFADGSFGYRPGRSAKDAILRVKEYAEQGYTFAVSLDLSKYFDTLNHEILINLLRKNVKDERVV